ncbi:MAG: nucleotidyltransferase [Candidatus Aminicenantales bacterium]|jgi:NDP-sugar pyrophosphorylase family protein
MFSLTLVVMAAGVGSRYGGLKQIDSFGPGGEVVMEYSVYDALKAGYDRIVFIIRKDFEDVFRSRVGKKVERVAETVYVCQSLDQVPPGFVVPEGRTKPWGTGQAVLACREAIRTPFTVINADDFYGRSTFETMADELRRVKSADGVDHYAMIGYRLANTLSEHGHVARGICEGTPDGYLINIRELLKVQKFPDGIKHTEDGLDWAPLPEESLVSMNFWGFEPSLFGELEVLFREFLRSNKGSLTKAEFLIPEAVGSLVRAKKARVKILPTRERWFGITYPQDRALAQAAILERVRQGLYPADLWQET